ncbi:MAG: 4-hydroxy-3-methylbut-2-enyl diphosphate reductase [Bacteroidales bacterium]|nr:4-hydroxy-3-methylbut-2-enyl diphosphate reductase [Bacteroidales bacterium]
MVEIDKYAGFCFGVTKAITSAENELSKHGSACCLGKIVHNQKEENRLEKLGLHTIDRNEMLSNPPSRMLIRAHGEPPSTYAEAKRLGITVVDETCPVVLKLQELIAQKFHNDPDCQIVIFGKKGHAEVNGLVGQTDGNAIVVSSVEEAEQLNLNGKIALFSQTTADYLMYAQVAEVLKRKNGRVDVHETVCGSVKNRIPRLQEFCRMHDVIVFVTDDASSNGRMLYEVCRSTNPKSYFVTDVADLKAEWFAGCNDVGVSGANSTPSWLLEEVNRKCEELIKNNED